MDQLFDLGRKPPTTKMIALQVRDHGAEPCEGDAVQLDAQSVSRLHARVPLLLREALPDAIRAWARRRVLVADLREDELSRRPAPRARPADVDARTGRARHRDRSVPADRRALQADAPRARG